MDSYMIRIYRKEENNPQMLVGIVQKVGADWKEVFSTLDELWSILNPVKKELTKRKKNKAPKPSPNGNGLGFKHKTIEQTLDCGLQTTDFKQQVETNGKKLHPRQRPKKI